MNLRKRDVTCGASKRTRQIVEDDASSAGGVACVVRLSLFSFSLSREAKRWLYSFKGNSLKTWDELVEKFLKKYFPDVIP